jgi:putative tricarboxylic transport membrane protein
LASVNGTSLRNRFSGLFWVAFSVFVCLESLQAGVGTLGRPGAGFLSFWSALILGLLAMILVVGSFAVRSKEPKTVELFGKRKRSNVVIALVSLLLYVVFVERAGYLVTTFGLMIILYVIAGRSRVWVQIIGAVVTVLVTYIVFDLWLGVQLPKGMLSF